jgi:hypothetical protein
MCGKAHQKTQRAPPNLQMWLMWGLISESWGGWPFLSSWKLIKVLNESVRKNEEIEDEGNGLFFFSFFFIIWFELHFLFSSLFLSYIIRDMMHLFFGHDNGTFVSGLVGGVRTYIYIYLHSLFSRPWFNPCRFVECLICWGSIFACVHHQQDPILLLLQCTTAFFKHVLWKSTIKNMYSGGLRLTFNLKLLYVLVHPLCTQLVQLL